MSDPTDWRDLAAAYALGALGPEEARAFEDAMASTPSLAAEVAEYRELNALLALRDAGAPPPPAPLRARVLDRVGEGMPRKPEVTPLPARRPRSGREVVLAIALAASVVLAVGLSLDVGNLRDAVSGLRDRLEETEAQLARRESTLNALLEPGVELVVLSATGERPPGIQIFWNRQAHTVVLHAFGLQPAPEGQTYQLWVIQNGTPVPSRTFNSEADGHALVEGIAVPAEGGIEAYAVTREPAGGSATPTLPILLFGSAPAG